MSPLEDGSYSMVLDEDVFYIMENTVVFVYSLQNTVHSLQLCVEWHSDDNAL
jgi:hypothetical protein